MIQCFCKHLACGTWIITAAEGQNLTGFLCPEIKLYLQRPHRIGIPFPSGKQLMYELSGSQPFWKACQKLALCHPQMLLWCLSSTQSTALLSVPTLTCCCFLFPFLCSLPSLLLWFLLLAVSAALLFVFLVCHEPHRPPVPLVEPMLCTN